MFDALSKGGKVVAPFAATFRSPGYRSLIDKFGVPWIVNTAEASSAGASS